jgi:hypothetical protein
LYFIGILFCSILKQCSQKWTKEEIQAVEKTLMGLISSGKVPGKAQCVKCIETSPNALQDRK